MISCFQAGSHTWHDDLFLVLDFDPENHAFVFQSTVVESGAIVEDLDLQIHLGCCYFQQHADH